MTTRLLTNSQIKLNLQKIPAHVAIIMDGNGRWAKEKGLPRIAGHRQGAKTLKEILRTCKDYGIKTLTVFAFSTENWGRPIKEVSFLMTLFTRLLQKELAEINREGVRLHFMGNLEPLPQPLQREISRATKLTRHNTTINFNVAINYGSRLEITQACRAIAVEVAKGQLTTGEIDEATISRHLHTFANSDPDLLIRTSGEMRLSNFLLWQLAYTEIYVTDTPWPDFNSEELLKAIANFQKRDRRFGKLKNS